jgi:hypothetical protein
MARLLLIVERTWAAGDAARLIFNYGDCPHLLLTPGISVEPGERFRPGYRLLLKRPDGSSFEGRIGRFSRFGYNRHEDWLWYESCIVLSDARPDDVPPGTEVWSIDHPPRRISRSGRESLG